MPVTTAFILPESRSRSPPVADVHGGSFLAGRNPTLDPRRLDPRLVGVTGLDDLVVSPRGPLAHDAVLDDKPLVTSRQGAEAMRDHEGRPALHEPIHRLHDLEFCLCIDGACGLVE